MDRLREQTGATDVEIGGASLNAFDAVAAVATNLYFIQPVGADVRVIGGGFFAVTQRQLLDQPANVPILLDGRRSDPTDSREIEVSEKFAANLDLEPGDLVSFESMTNEYLSAWFSGMTVGRPDGPLLDLRVTGIVLGTADLSNPVGTVYLTEAFGDEYGSVVAHFDFLHVRLRDPSRAEALVAAGAVGGGGVSEWSDVGEVDDGLRVVALGLWVFAGVAALSGMAVFWLLARRLAKAFHAETRAMSTIGLDRRGVARGGVLLFLPAISIGIAAALVATPFVAVHLRLGLAGVVEPDRGVHLDLAVMMLGGVGLALVTVVTAATSLDAWRRSDLRAEPGRASWLPVRRPVSLTLGIRDAVQRGEGQQPNRAMLLMSTTMTAAAVASIVFGFSLNALADTPRAWGEAGDVNIGIGDSDTGAGAMYGQSMNELADDDRIRDLNGWILFDANIEGPTVKGVALDVRRGEPIITVLAGRPPRTATEVGLGKATMELLGHRLGDQIAITVGGTSEMFEVVGQLAFPDGDMTFDDGAAITQSGSLRFEDFEEQWLVYYTVVNWADGVDHEQAEGDLSDAGFELAEAPLPSAVDNLGQIGGLPSMLSGFFVLLALSAVAYSLSLGSRTGRRRAAVLAALGLDPRSCRRVIGYQAITFGLVTLIFAIPIGLIGGRMLWSAVTGRAGIVTLHTDPAAVAWGTVGVGLAVSIVIGAGFVIGMRRHPLHAAIRAD